MEITAKMVAELRARSGLPMMKCKKALVEADGDIEKAIDNLRKEGEKTIGKLSSREMKEGLVFTHQAADGAAAVSVLCETEPVATSAPIGEFGGIDSGVLGVLIRPNSHPNEGQNPRRKPHLTFHNRLLSSLDGFTHPPRAGRLEVAVRVSARAPRGWPRR